MYAVLKLAWLLMDSRILLGRILQRFEDKGKAKVVGYNEFKYVRETESSVIVLRQNGSRTPIPHARILKGIEYYQKNSESYSMGPSALGKARLTHVTSPIFALLHLLPKEAFR